MGKTAKEGASEVEEDSKESESDKDGEGVTEFDKAIYDELRARRDFGFEQVNILSILLIPHTSHAIARNVRNHTVCAVKSLHQASLERSLPGVNDDAPKLL